MSHKWGAQIDGLRVDLISLDLEPDLDNANVGKYMSRMDGRMCRCSLFCVNWGHHFSQSISGAGQQE